MRIEQLECIAAITRLGSMRRASEELHISQPALSETVRNLERELGVNLLDRRRSGARISDDGRELLPLITDLLESADRLRAAADDQHRSGRTVRMGTTSAATVPIVTPAIADFRASSPDTLVEVVAMQQTAIHTALLDGALDIGLVNLMATDDAPTDLDTIELLRGQAVVCCRSDSRFAALCEVTVDDLRGEPFIGMRPGYLMHRYVHRLFGKQGLSVSYSTDGAEMGKLMVAQGLGVTILPDYSVVSDPLVEAGLLTFRPLAAEGSAVTLAMQSRRSRHVPVAVRRLQRALVRRSRDYPVDPGDAARAGRTEPAVPSSLAG